MILSQPSESSPSPKNRRALAVVNSAMASGAVPRTAASRAATWATLAGSLGCILRSGSGEQNGESVSISSLSSGTIAAAWRSSSVFLNVTIPEKLIIMPMSSARRTFAGGSVQQCSTMRAVSMPDSRNTPIESSKASRVCITTTLPSRLARASCSAKMRCWASRGEKS